MKNNEAFSRVKGARIMTENDRFRTLAASTLSPKQKKEKLNYDIEKKYVISIY